MKKINRRQFIKRSLTTTAGAYLGLSSLNVSPAYSANNEIRVAIIGMGVRGGQHTPDFQNIDGVNIVAFCDPDRQRLNRHIEEFKKKYSR
ncbi:MAG: twin-arginine translocation signal domain-containing protein, partial [Sedimentisphaerales bacterium]|nr:twin-arginine translocation signal domain-containing protein [Sedimentisphaerales bacterium]